MKQTRLLVLILLTIVGAVAAAVTPPTDLSLRGIVEWVGVGGHIASGTSTILPPVGAVGSRYTHLYNASKPIEYRSTGTAWRQMWTWNHSQLSNLEYVLSGHGIVPISYGGTGATNTVDARTNLDVFSTASTTALVDDLSGVTEVASARDNLDIYSTEETNQLIAQTATDYVATDTFTGHTDATAAHGVGEIAGIDDIPLNASFSFDLLSDSPDYTGNGGKVLALNAEGTALQWAAVAGVGSMSHAALSHLDYDSSGHTGFTGATETASITSTLQAVIASVSAELDPMNYQENYDVIASTSALVVPLSGRTYVGIQNIDEVKNIHVYPNGLVASSGPANLILYAGETWYQRLTDSVPVAFYASEATPIVIFQGK